VPQKKHQEKFMTINSKTAKDIPLSANLKEEVSTMEAKMASLEPENAILKDDLRKANIEIRKLKSQIEGLPQIDLHETEVKLLRLIAKPGFQPYVQEFESVLPLEQERIKYHLQNLVDLQYISSNRTTRTLPERYELEQKGRDYLVQNKWI